MARAKGVLPDEVIRDHRSDGIFVLANYRREIDATRIEDDLERLTQLVSAATAPMRGERAASICVGLGPSFFSRFGLANVTPAGFAALPAAQNVQSFDLGIYAMFRSSAVIAQFLQGLAETASLTGVVIEQGYQRTDGRELFGFRDGLRNVPRAERDDVAFVDVDVTPWEPAWTAGGTYFTYMKLPQNIEEFNQLPLEQQEAIIGRRKSDGSRLDLPEGSDPRAEGEMAGAAPPTHSHVRKAGPRGALHDEVKIFRRGVPFLTLNADGSVYGGLQFAAFTSSLDSLAVILDRWMTNDAFPAPGTGVDGLFAQGFVTVEKTAFFFVPPYERGRPIGAAMFDSVRPTRPRAQGKIAIRKTLVDQNNNPMLNELGGFEFQVFDANANAIGDVFMTNPAGHALSGDVPTNVPLSVREVSAPAGFPGQLAPEQPVTLTTKRTTLAFVNTIPTGSTYG